MESHMLGEERYLILSTGFLTHGMAYTGDISLIVGGREVVQNSYIVKGNAMLQAWRKKKKISFLGR